MGHKSGLIKSYFKPTDTELLEGNDKSIGYVGVIPYLTINATEQENEKLRKQLQKLTIEEDHITQLRVEIEKMKALMHDRPLIEGN